MVGGSSIRWLVFLFFALTVDSIAQSIKAIDISFVDELHGWVAEAMPSVFRTDDGGRTWLRTPVAAKSGFYRICFFDQNTGIAVAHLSDEAMGVFRTEDAGQTWKIINTIKTPNHEHVVDVTLLSRDAGFLVGEGDRGHVWQFLDGGRALKEREDLPIDYEKQSNALGVFGDRTGHVWITGKGFILHSADDGKTWANQFANADPGLDMPESGVAVAGGHSWISAANWEIVGTHDYGQHWARELSTRDEGNINFDSLSFLNSSEGCAVGDSSFIFCTKDGGETWSRKKVFRPFPKDSLLTIPSKLFLFSSGHGWANNNGTLYKTEDGGSSFKAVRFSSAPR